MPDPSRHATWRGLSLPPPCMQPWPAPPQLPLRLHLCRGPGFPPGCVPGSRAVVSRVARFYRLAGRAPQSGAGAVLGSACPWPRSGGAAGCCGPRLSSASSAHGLQTGRLGTAPPPSPALSGPFPSGGHLVPPWSPSCCQRPPHKPGVCQVAPSLRWEELPLPGDEGKAAHRGSALVLQSVSVAGPGWGDSAEPGRQHWRPWVSSSRTFVPSSGRLDLGLLSGLLWLEGLWAETRLRTHSQLPSVLSLLENQPLRKKRESLC